LHWWRQNQIKVVCQWQIAAMHDTLLPSKTFCNLTCKTCKSKTGPWPNSWPRGVTFYFTPFHLCSIMSTMAIWYAMTHGFWWINLYFWQPRHHSWKAKNCILGSIHWYFLVLLVILCQQTTFRFTRFLWKTPRRLIAACLPTISNVSEFHNEL
jgi:hypothetical protein